MNTYLVPRLEIPHSTAPWAQSSASVLTMLGLRGMIWTKKRAQSTTGSYMEHRQATIKNGERKKPVQRTNRLQGISLALCFDFFHVSVRQDHARPRRVFVPLIALRALISLRDHCCSPASLFTSWTLSVCPSRFGSYLQWRVPGNHFPFGWLSGSTLFSLFC